MSHLTVKNLNDIQLLFYWERVQAAFTARSTVWGFNRLRLIDSKVNICSLSWAWTDLFDSEHLCQNTVLHKLSSKNSQLKSLVELDEMTLGAVIVSLVVTSPDTLLAGELWQTCCTKNWAEKKKTWAKVRKVHRRDVRRESEAWEQEVCPSGHQSLWKSWKKKNQQH